MTDISPVLRRAAATVAHWSVGDVRAAATALSSGESSRHADWDEEAGERWARVLDDDGVIGFVSGQVPLIIVRSGVEPFAAEAAVEVVKVNATDADELRADLGAIQEALPELAAAIRDDPTLLNLDAFSAEALWFASV